MINSEYILVNICRGMDHLQNAWKVEFSYSDFSTFLSLECRNIEGEAILVTNNRIKMHGLMIPITRTYIPPNPFWREYEVPACYAIGFVNLLKQKHWTIDEAAIKVSRKWNNPFENIVGSDLGFKRSINPEIINPAQLELPFKMKGYERKAV